MDPPSSGSQPSAGGINQMAFCHECGIEIRPLMTPDPTCPRCNGQFVEIIDQGTASHPSDFFDDPDDDDDFPFQPMHPHTGRAGPAPSLAFGAPPAGQGLGGLLMALASGAARAQEGANRAQQPSSSGAQPDSGQGPRSPDSESQSATRSGSTSFGPFGLQWNVQYGSGGGDPYQRAAQQQQQQQQQQQEMRTPPTLSNFLRFAFGADTTGERMQQPDDEHVHDDGMGGAGSAADGRRFNHDNRGTGTYHQPPQSPQARTDELPPELAALRNLFTGLFGEPGAPGGGGGSLLDVLAAGAHGGPRGQWGDYVLGQQGLDDIISQLMEQTQGSNAPPPATDEVIEKLERFTRADTERIKRAKNQDCPTCKDDFLPTPGEEKQEGEETDQQDELVSMPCAHIFHEDCLVPWLRLHGTCPVCRVSIAKPRGEGDAGAPGGSTDAARGDAQEGAAADAAATVPGGWPSPPNPFSAFFNTAFGSGNGNGNGNTLSGSGNGYGNGSGNGNGNGNVGGDARVSHDSRGATTTTFQTQPPASTTITSTVYPSPPATAGGTSSGVEVNAIVSSPPLVDDRDDFFPPQQEGESRDAMRDRIRRATEARMGEPTLEPDELD